MAAVMGGTMRSPFTGLVFALELTCDVRLLLPLLIAVVVAHAFTVLFMRRSILTEKVARRGYHFSREYSLDPLERLVAEDVMTRNPITVPASLPVQELVSDYFLGTARHRHQGYPVVGKDDELIGIVTKSDLLHEWLGPLGSPSGAGLETGAVITYDVATLSPIMISARESCRTAAERMAEANDERLLVVALRFRAACSRAR
jgi:CBS domain-containing protein